MTKLKVKSRKYKGKSLRRALFTFYVMLFTSAPSGAAERPGFDFLNMGVGTRQIAMGETAVGMADDINAGFWNPAALGEIRQQEISLSYASFIESSHLSSLAYGHPIHGLGTFGGQIHSFRYGEVQGYDNNDVKTGVFLAEDQLLSLGYGRGFRNSLTAGVAVKRVSQRIGDTSGDTLAGDAGLLYHPGRWGWLSRTTLGLAFRNAGPAARFINDTAGLPASLDVGISRRAWIDALTMAADVRFPKFGDVSWRLGGELWLYSTLALRAGYRPADLGTGLSLGLGFRYRHAQIDYAYVGYGSTFGATHRVGVIYRFGGVVESLYRQAVTLSQKDHYAEAIMKFKEVLDIDVRHRGALRGLRESVERLGKENVP